MRHRHANILTTAICLFGLAVTSASAQIDPILFPDVDGAGNLITDSVCDVVNAGENGQIHLVVTADTAQLVFVDGFNDVILTDTEVILEDSDFLLFGDVLFEGELAGFIAFQDDGDGLRSLWWIDLNGFVVQTDGFTGRPTSTNSRPQELVGASCDACDFLDDFTLCGECSFDDDCDDDNVCTDDVCSAGVCVYFDAPVVCDDQDTCTVGDICLAGACVGTPILDCEPDDPPRPPVTITFCGNGTAMIFPLILMMLGLAKLGLISRRNSHRAIVRNGLPGETE